jgi:hypothetical protein
MSKQPHSTSARVIHPDNGETTKAERARDYVADLAGPLPIHTGHIDNPPSFSQQLEWGRKNQHSASEQVAAEDISICCLVAPRTDRRPIQVPGAGSVTTQSVGMSFTVTMAMSTLLLCRSPRATVNDSWTSNQCSGRAGAVSSQ